MKLLTFLAPLAFVVTQVSAQGAVVNIYSDDGCANWQETFTLASNGGQCRSWDPDAGILLASISDGCTSRFTFRASPGSAAKSAYMSQ